MIVYGSVAQPLKRTFSIASAALTTLLITVSMIGLSVAWEWWKERRGGKQEGSKPVWPSPLSQPAKTRS
jgi:hypothetical protein